MKLRKFYVENMQQAMQVIKDEIGPDAVILSSKQVRKKKGILGMFSKKIFEVVAGYEEEEKKPRPEKKEWKLPDVKVPETAAPEAKPEAFQPIAAYRASMEAAAGQQPVQQNNANEKLGESIGELKVLVEQLSKKMTMQEIPAEKRYSKEVMEVLRTLEENDVDKETAEELCARIEATCAARGVAAVEVARSFLRDVLGNPHTIECTKFKQKTVMLIGPTGVGKTTTLVKLAYMLSCQKNMNVGIINADVFRVAAQDHLKAYCEILHTDLITVYKPEEVQEALEAFKDKDVVLIDTAGRLSDDNEYRLDIAKMIGFGKIEDIYITLAASTSERVLRHTLKNYSFLKAYNIIVTKTDEVQTNGMMVSLAKISGMPLSYMTTGQNVPDDIQEVSIDDVVESILG